MSTQVVGADAVTQVAMLPQAGCSASRAMHARSA
jgi:hypothetical protein